MKKRFEKSFRMSFFLKKVDLRWHASAIDFSGMYNVFHSFFDKAPPGMTWTLRAAGSHHELQKRGGTLLRCDNGPVFAREKTQNWKSRKKCDVQNLTKMKNWKCVFLQNLIELNFWKCVFFYRDWAWTLAETAVPLAETVFPLAGNMFPLPETALPLPGQQGAATLVRPRTRTQNQKFVRVISVLKRFFVPGPPEVKTPIRLGVGGTKKTKNRSAAKGSHNSVNSRKIHEKNEKSDWRKRKPE